MMAAPNILAACLPMNPQQLIDALPTFVVSSAGSQEALAKLTLQAAAQSMPLLAQLADAVGHPSLQPVPVESFAFNESSQKAASALKQLFDFHGSDKASSHNYHHLYGAILHNPEAVSAVFEVGLGTNNEDVVSNMGRQGRPGASLRAFRDYLPKAQIFGADVDRRVLFEEERIRTFFIDQTDLAVVNALAATLDVRFDLIIDDGLHSPNANLATMLFALKKLKPGGVFVVEDVHPAHFPVWQIVSALLPPLGFKSFFSTASGGCLFVVQSFH